MNLLVITNNPNRASFRQRIGIYLDYLNSNGINCTVELLPSGIISRQKLFKSAANYDGVFLHKKKLNSLDARTLRKYSKKIIYNYDDAIMFSDKKPKSYSRSHFVPFKRTIKLADMVIVGSDYLAQQGQSFNSNIHILPIGLNTSDYKPDSDIKKDDNIIRLVWIGSDNTLSYLKDIVPVIEEIGSKYNNVKLRIICDSFLDLKNIEVEKRKWAAQTRGHDLCTSDIGLAPLPENPFTRGKCSFKVLEYSAACLPVIASPIGTNSKYIKDKITGFLANNYIQWYDSLVELIENANLRIEMGKAGQSYANEYDISIIAKQLSELIINCLQSDSKIK